MNIKGKKAIVTGGSSGYGFGIGKVLAGAGAEVCITGLNETKLAEAAVKLGAGVRAIQADVTSAADWDMLFAATGDVDILVNNAGAAIRIAPVADQEDAEIAVALNINLLGAMLGCRRAAKAMVPRGTGMIINISSVCAHYSWPGWSVYSAAKAGVERFSLGLHTELRPHGVRVTCLTPSWGQTNFNRATNISGASEDASTAQKCTSPEELGNIVKFLVETPEHLTIPELTVMPMIQDICPM